MHLLVIKFIRNFATAIIIFYSKRLIYFIDNYFNDKFDDQQIVCSSCGAEFRSAVLKKINKDKCTVCGTELDFSEEEEKYNERTSRVEYRRNQW